MLGVREKASRTHEAAQAPVEFVLHSLRHTMLTRLGESGANAFTIMKIAGQRNVTVSRRSVHLSPNMIETAFERLDALNGAERGEPARIPAIFPRENRDEQNRCNPGLHQ